jgi:spore germination cell wall hydrolase CwlJ-like protein
VKSNFQQHFKEVLGDLPPIEPINVPGIVQTVDARPSGDLRNYYSSQKYIDTVTACIVLEAGGEGTKGMEAVNEVLTNRARAETGNDSFESKYKVATKPKQFSCFNNGIDTAIAAAKKHPKWNEAKKIVESPPTNHTSGARYYYANKGRNAIRPPNWAVTYLKRGAKTVQIGNHIFLYGFRGN